MTQVLELWQVLGAQLFRNNRIDEICPFWKTRAKSRACLVSLPANEAMHFNRPVVARLYKSWAHSFSAQSHWWNLSWKTRANSSRFSLYPPNGALPNLFPTVPVRPRCPLPCRSLPTELSPSYFPRFPVRPPCPRFRALPKLFPTVSRRRLSMVHQADLGHPILKSTHISVRASIWFHLFSVHPYWSLRPYWVPQFDNWICLFWWNKRWIGMIGGKGSEFACLTFVFFPLNL